jgi:hypothetical protein
MRTIIGLISIIVVIWITMLAGLVVIFVTLPFLTSTLSEELGRLFEQIILAGLSIITAFVWLTMWRKLAFGYFSRILRRNEESNGS